MPGPGRGRKSESKQEIGLVLSLKPHYMQILRHAESTLEPAIGTNDSTRHINGGERKRDRTERRARPMFEKRARDELVERDARQGVAASLDAYPSRKPGCPHRAASLDAYPSRKGVLVKRNLSLLTLILAKGRPYHGVASLDAYPRD